MRQDYSVNALHDGSSHELQKSYRNEKPPRYSRELVPGNAYTYIDLSYPHSLLLARRRHAPVAKRTIRPPDAFDRIFDILPHRPAVYSGLFIRTSSAGGFLLKL